MTSSSLPPLSTPAARTRYAGLDGMRAVAVALVVVYHLFPPAFSGGFIGVDVFFVISGFLITSLLLREKATTGRISLGKFWQRRARRLLPAVTVMIAVCATAALFVGGDVLVRMGAQVLGALTFTYNWVSIGAGASYFAADTPELFRNLWSLGIEEQFYVLWPLLLMLLLLLRSRWLRIGVVLAGAAASAVWMATLVSQGADPTRAYFGTDSHAFGLLAGVALAFAWTAIPASAPGWMLRRATHAATVALGSAALVGLVVLAFVPASDTASTFPGALLLATAFSLLAIVCAIWPGSPFGRALDAAPLRYVGDRSYAIYLWHWPLVVLLTIWATGHSPDVGVPVWVGLFALVLTMVAAELSYRLVEMPVRRLGFRGCLRLWGHRIVESAGARWATLGSGALAITLLVGTTAAVASAPVQTSAQDVVQAGLDALASASPEPTEVGVSAGPTPPPAAPPAGSPGSHGGSSPAPTATERPNKAPAPSPEPTPVRGDEVSAIGDSVMLAAAPALLEHLPGIQIDAAVSRSMWAGPGIVQHLADTGQLRRYVVVALGTNGPVDAGSLAELRRIAGPDRQVILVNSFAPRNWIEGVNRDLADFAADNRGTWIADWSSAIAGQTQLLAGDNIHPSAGGGDVFASVVQEQIDAAELQRATAESRVRFREHLLERGLIFPLPS